MEKQQPKLYGLTYAGSEDVSRKKQPDCCGYNRYSAVVLDYILLDLSNIPPSYMAFKFCFVVWEKSTVRVEFCASCGLRTVKCGTC